MKKLVVMLGLVLIMCLLVASCASVLAQEPIQEEVDKAKDDYDPLGNIAPESVDDWTKDVDEGTQVAIEVLRVYIDARLDMVKNTLVEMIEDAIADLEERIAHLEQRVTLLEAENTALKCMD